MKEPREKRPVFFSILLSYLITMALPMVLLSFLFFWFLYQTYDKELIRNEADALTWSQTLMDDVVREMQSNASILLNSNEFQPGYLMEAYGNFYDVTRRLSNITYTNTFVDGYYYLNGEVKMLYSRETMFDYNRFCKYGLLYKGMTAENLEDKLLQNRATYWLPAEHNNSEGFITYLATNKTSRLPPSAAILFQIKESTLKEILNQDSRSQQRNILMIYEGKLLYSSSDDFSQELLAAVQGELAYGEGKLRVQLNGEEHLVFYTGSDSTAGLQYVSIVSFSSLMQTVSFYQAIFIAVILVVSLACSFAVLRFMNIIYTPMQQFSVMINKMSGATSLKSDREQLSMARKTLTELQESRQKSLRRDLLIELLSGCFTEQKAFEQEAQKLELDLYGEFYNVILLQLKSDGMHTAPPNLCENIGAFWTGSLPANLSGQFLSLPETASIALLVAGTTENLEALYLRLDGLRLATESNWDDIKLVVGVGMETSCTQVPMAYFQAEKACDYRLFQQNGGLVFFRDISGDNKWKGIYPSREIDNLYHAISQIDQGRVFLSLQSLLSEILSTDSLLYCSYILRDVLTTSVRALHELDCDAGSVAQLSQEFTYALNNEDSLRQYISDLGHAITDSFSDHKKSADCGAPSLECKSDSLQNILDYIATHFCEETFSVKTVADNFNMSVSNLSHYFKKNTGQNLSEYIASLRFEQAKQLLRNTDLLLQDISVQCGYLHLSTFMRQFKQREGCTPASYRASFRPKSQ
ncbi:helix-turn-helix domain-containing protein [Acutalibacter sp. 1XD8-36]|uniref:helix-turn-helix domain-containing protein n=1 Tax=Acutalibacter sp. 1XD8-36 TaxID=2320852 RepID=UPI0014120D74|nr:AraC family transcriptional regulator [Acutalibacter sp. 1XD8-36]NBJ88475.1 AraC family transcriptional regulator [Acutalibacter sp. 1XD8-36]